MTNPGILPDNQKRTSTSALAALISGVLCCAPVAIVLAIVGFMQTGKPGVKGRWMAVMGGVFGLFGVATWAIMLIFTLFFGGLSMLLQTVGKPESVTREFIMAVDASNTSEALLQSKANVMTQAKIEEMEKGFKELGGIAELTTDSANITSDTATVNGTLKFKNGIKLDYEADLIDEDHRWRVGDFTAKQ